MLVRLVFSLFITLVSFFNMIGQSFENELEENRTPQDKKVKRLKKELIINSNFDLNELFQSGYILFNDTISNYVNSVADQVIKEEPELNGKLKIYVIKSTETNAYCFENGTVFVNMGLIARLDNEAQLALG